MPCSSTQPQFGLAHFETMKSESLSLPLEKDNCKVDEGVRKQLVTHCLKLFPFGRITIHVTVISAPPIDSSKTSSLQRTTAGHHFFIHAKAYILFELNFSASQSVSTTLLRSQTWWQRLKRMAELDTRISCMHPCRVRLFDGVQVWRSEYSHLDGLSGWLI